MNVNCTVRSSLWINILSKSIRLESGFSLMGVFKFPENIYSAAIKSIQFLVLNTGSHVIGSVKMFIWSFCQTSSSVKHKPELFCNH